MPMHDWSRVPAGLFHHFHQHWSIEIAATLNRGRLPKGVAALVEQRSGPKESHVLAIESRGRAQSGFADDPGIATMTPPVTRFVSRTTKQIYATRANLVVLKHHLGRTIAVIEIVSPGNKDSRAALRDFVDKTIAFLRPEFMSSRLTSFRRRRATHSEYTRASGTKLRRRSSHCPRERTEFSPHMKLAACRLATSRRSAWATSFWICHCFGRMTGTCRFRWNRRTRRPGTPALKNCVWPSRRA